MQAVLSTRAGGDVVLVGNQPVSKQISLDLIEQMMRRQLNMHGSWMSYSAPFPRREWSGSLALMQAGKLALDAIISHRISLSELMGRTRLVGDAGIVAPSGVGRRCRREFHHP
jgi:threonine dehydrogenase-like Zn-dependent dehydrogenase